MKSDKLQFFKRIFIIKSPKVFTLNNKRHFHVCGMKIFVVNEDKTEFNEKKKIVVEFGLCDNWWLNMLFWLKIHKLYYEQKYWMLKRGLLFEKSMLSYDMFWVCQCDVSHALSINFLFKISYHWHLPHFFWSNHRSIYSSIELFVGHWLLLVPVFLIAPGAMQHVFQP